MARGLVRVQAVHMGKRDGQHGQRKDMSVWMDSGGMDGESRLIKIEACQCRWRRSECDGREENKQVR